MQRMQLQDSTRISYGTSAPNQKTLQQSTYPPHLLNWVYLAIAEQNPSQPPDQVVFRESFVKNRIYSISFCLCENEEQDLFSSYIKFVKKNENYILENYESSF